jgi:glutaconate CoA-transferase subunit A
MFLGPDLYWDDLMLQAAPTGGRFISAERIVETADLRDEGCIHQLRISRMMVDGVVRAPGGAHFTLCEPDYPRDEAVQGAYAASARSPEAWEAFRAEWIDIPEAEYQRKVREALSERPGGRESERGPSGPLRSSKSGEHL